MIQKAKVNSISVAIDHLRHMNTYTTGTVRHHQVLLKGLFLHRG